MEINADSGTSVALIRQTSKKVNRPAFLVVACCGDALEEILFHTLMSFPSIEIVKLFNSNMKKASWSSIREYTEHIVYNQEEGTDRKKRFCCPKRSFKVLAEIAEYHKQNIELE